MDAGPRMRRRVALAVAALVAALVVAAPGAADGPNTLTVTGTADTATPAAANCTGAAPNYNCPTLRDAVAKANSDATGDTINLAASGVYTLSQAIPLSLTTAMTIHGAGTGATRSKIDGNDATRL